MTKIMTNQSKFLQKQGYRPIDFIVLFLFLGCLIALIYIVINLKGDAYQCLNSPLNYGAMKLEETNKAEIQCSCNLMKPNAPTLYFNANKSWFWNPAGEVYDKPDIEDFNFSKILIKGE